MHVCGRECFPSGLLTPNKRMQKQSLVCKVGTGRNRLCDGLLFGGPPVLTQECWVDEVSLALNLC